MTPDGINKRDWAKVHVIACRIANAAIQDDKQGCHRWTKELMTCLDTLEHKYGRLPSIVATRADFGGNARQRIKLWKEAYSLALVRGDKKNLALISSSLAGFMIDDQENADAGQRWLDIMKGHMREDDKEDYRKLRKRLRQLQEN
jgi:hypothetical protein